MSIFWYYRVTYAVTLVLPWSFSLGILIKYHKLSNKDELI